MAKAPSESRIPMFGSRIPIPGKFRFLPNLTLRNGPPPTNVKQENTNIDSNKPPPDINRTITRSTNLETMLPPANTQCNSNETIVVSTKNEHANIDMNCTVTLDAGAAEATFVLCSARETNQVKLSKSVTAQDVGKKVCVAKQIGVLCFVGEVRFNAGLWCGVELSEAVGKHDGCVKGVRYFSCRPGCGIMVPVSKVTLLLDNKRNKACDTTFNNMIPSDQTVDSGPFSLLEVKSSHIDARVNCKDAFVTNKDIEEPQTDQSLVTHINSEPALPLQKNRFSYVISYNCSNNAAFEADNLNVKRTISYSSPFDNVNVVIDSSTPYDERKGKLKKKLHDDGCTKILPPDKLDLTSFDNSELDKTFIANTPHSPVETPGLTKQNSFDLDESLGILTPDQMVDFSMGMKNSNTLSSDDLKSILTPKRQEKIIKTPSSENLNSLPILSLDSSNTYDESLMILSQGQMADFSMFLSTSKTPSCEDMKSVSSSKRSDRTISNSRTPSSENLGSLPHDGFKQPTNLIETTECVEKLSTHAPRPQSIDLKPSVELSVNSSKISTNVQAEISSPNAVENSIIDFSLGLIEEDILATGNQFSSLIDTTTNLELPLDSISGDGKVEQFKSLSRSDQTPSPEDLPLDPIDSIKQVELDMLEPNLLMPSTDSDPKTDTSKSATTTKTNSFITSVTSITSLDTGYQGDGEMSRPASRGADHSPMAHKPNNPALVNLQWQRAIARRQDPMTDSDFFTESDADIHEENAPRGDRRAQVIDGTLYGVNAQAPAAHDIFIGNQEEMDSSGVFTDLDLNPRTDDLSDGERNKMDVTSDVKSPSEVSTKSVSENSQIKETDHHEKTLTNEFECTLIEATEIITEKPKSPVESVISNSSNTKNLRTRTPECKEGNPSKKFKMPKRNVVSKVKTMMEQTKQTNVEHQETRKYLRKTANRWDDVMDKISQGKEKTKTKIRLKEVKSKISTGVADISPIPNKRGEIRKAEELASSKTKIHRVRARGENLVRTKPNSRTTTTTSSVHSSLSDLSTGLSHNNKQVSTHAAINRVTKKRETGVGRCTTPLTEVLTPGGHKPIPVTSPRTTLTASQRTTRDIKKSPLLSTPVSATTPASGEGNGKTSSGRRTPSRRIGAGTAQKSASAAKDQSRVTGVPSQKGGSPLRNQVLQEKTQSTNLLPHIRHSAKGIEALGVLVQYLVFNLDAFRTPSLKRELDNIKTQWIKDKLELEETRMGYRRLEDTVSEQKILAAQTLEEERVKYRAEIAEIFEKHRRDVTELNEKNLQEKLKLEERFQKENLELKNQLDAEISNRENEISVRIETYVSEHRYRIQELEQENEKLRRDHQISVEILREENDSIREQLDEKTSLIEDLKELQFINEKLKNEFNHKEKAFDEKLAIAQDEIALLKEENKKILETFKSDTKDNKLQNGSPEKCSVVSQAALGRCTQLQDEVESLRTVLDLKLAELSELRRAHGELSQAAEELPAALLRAQTLQARVEDLELQLERKSEMELQLTKENKRLQESFNQESKQNKRLSLYNEELQWKLKQNSEVVNAILQGQTPNRKSLHGSNQSLCDDISCKTPTGSYLSRSYHTSSFNEKHLSTSHILERTLSFRERTNQFFKDTSSRKSESPNDRFHHKPDYFELDDSPPSSPKVKGVVEKSDSVSWVLDMDESPEVIASRMVRRAGSFRNVTPPKSTPTKSPASKRPRTKANNLSLSASAGAIVSPEDKNDNRYRSKSVSLRDSQSPENCHPGEYLSNSWHYSLRTSTPTKSGLEPIRSGIKLENNPDLEHDSDVAISLPALPSEICRNKPDSLPSLPSGDLLLLQSSFPKNSAGEAMVSESNSEDECSSSTSERSPSASDTETSEEPTPGSGDKKHPKMQYDLFLLTESTTNSEAMDCSWSEELDV